MKSDTVVKDIKNNWVKDGSDRGRGARLDAKGFFATKRGGDFFIPRVPRPAIDAIIEGPNRYEIPGGEVQSREIFSTQKAEPLHIECTANVKFIVTRIPKYIT